MTCALGIKSLGFVLIGFAAGQAAFSVVIGKIERVTGRRIIIFSFYIVSVGLFVFLLKWNPRTSPSYIFYIVAGIFGVVKCVWRTETNCEYFQSAAFILCSNQMPCIHLSNWDMLWETQPGN